MYSTDQIKFSFSEKATKNLRNLPHGFDLVGVKTMRKIAQIFVAISEKLNFNIYKAMVNKLRPTTIGRIRNLCVYNLYQPLPTIWLTLPITRGLSFITDHIVIH